MENKELEQLKYPIGHFNCPATITKEQFDEWVVVLKNFPDRLVSLVKNLTKEQLDTPYRPEGWTVRQLIHHIADSHHHSYTRFKWALTEDAPIIKAYEEKDWANQIDARTAPVELLLTYISALHAKLIYFLEKLSSADLEKYYIHPDGAIKVSVAENIGKYAWHSNHHYAHIESLCKRRGW